MENQKKAQLNNDGFNEDSIANILSFGPSNNSPDNGR